MLAKGLGMPVSGHCPGPLEGWAQQCQLNTGKEGHGDSMGQASLLTHHRKDRCLGNKLVTSTCKREIPH